MFHPEIPDMKAARAALESGAWTPAALNDVAWSRIRAWEPTIQAFLCLDEAARPQAVAAGPLAGMPTGVKDLADVRGLPTTGGSRAYRWVAETDAPVVARLRQAGAHIVGKTNTQELAFGVVTAPTVNPWDTTRIPGGSSGGSAAALAAGMILAGLGTDTGGSVRIPAACCGVVGFKPTYGHIPVEGIMPLSYTCDHVGPLAHSVEDAALLYHIMAGRTPRPVTARKPRRVLVPGSYFGPRLTRGMAASFNQVLNALRAAAVPIEPLAMEPWSVWLDLQLTVRLPEAYVYHREVLEGPRRSLLGGDVAARLDPGRDMPATRYVEARQARKALWRRWSALVPDDAVVVMPTIPTTAPAVGADEVAAEGGPISVWEALISLTAPWNVLGWPAISVPGPLAEDGLPTGIQLIGKSGTDEALLDQAAWVADKFPVGLAPILRNPPGA